MTFSFSFDFSATKVSIERKNILSPDEIERLEKLYQQMLGPAIDIYRRDLTERGEEKQSTGKATTNFFVFRFAIEFISKK